MIKGKFNRFLIVNAETSGLIFGDNPAVDCKTDQYCQAVSIGCIVVDANTLSSIEEVYVEIQWDGTSQWHDKAQQSHGLSKEYLISNGLSRPDVVEEIGSLILHHFGPDTAIVVAGHNPYFHISFLKELMRSEGIELKFSNRMIDTNSIGFAVFGTYTAEELFEMVSPKRKFNSLNAIGKAQTVLKVLNVVKQLTTHLEG